MRAKAKPVSSGFALLLVLWTLVILSTLALTFAVTAGTEIRASQDAWVDLQASELARAGHEFASYLQTRGLGTSGEDLSGLPVERVVPGLTYRVTLVGSSIDLFFEGENAKLDIAAAPEDVSRAFFTAWTGDPERGREIAASIADWMDADNMARPFGAESESYAGRGYLPRNSGLGLADLLLVKGLTAQDFAPAIVDNNGIPSVRQPLSRFISFVPAGAAVNPNYASRTVLQSVPGLTESLVDSIMQLRQQTPFVNSDDFLNRTNLPPNSPLVPYFVFARGIAPAIRSIAHISGSLRTHSERRVRRRIADPRNRRLQIDVLASVERGMHAE
jgi:type II secretory pathway component PulK